MIVITIMKHYRTLDLERSQTPTEREQPTNDFVEQINLAWQSIYVSFPRRRLSVR